MNCKGKPDPVVNPVRIRSDGRRCIPPTIHFRSDLLDLELDSLYTAIQEKLKTQLDIALEKWEDYEKQYDFRAPLDEIQPIITEILGYMDGHPIRNHPFLSRLISGKLDTEQVVQFMGQFSHVVENTGRVAALCLGKFQERTPSITEARHIRIADFTEHLLTKLILFEYSPRLTVTEGPLDYTRLFNTETALSRFERLYTNISGDTELKHLMLHGTADYVITARILAVSDAFTEIEALAATSVESILSVPFFYSVILASILKYALKEKVALQEKDLDYMSSLIQFTIDHSPAFLLALALNRRDDKSRELMKQSVSLLLRSRYEMLNDLHRKIFGTRATSIEEMDKERNYSGRDNRIENELLIARQQTHKNSIVDHELYKNKKNNPFTFHD